MAFSLLAPADDLRLIAMARNGAVSLMFAIAVAGLLYAADLLPMSGQDSETISPAMLALIFFGWVIFSPLVETMALALIHALARPWLSLRYAAWLSALVMAALHGLIWPFWPLTLAVPFLIFVRAFAAGMPLKQAAYSAAATHALHNGYAFALLVAADAASL